MFERFTEPARRSLFFARHELSKLGGGEITQDHLLLGLLRSPHGFTGTRLQRAGLRYADVRGAVESRSAGLPTTPSATETPFSLRARRVLELTAEEADRLNHSHIGTEHVLLGLVREAESTGDEFFLEHGVTLESLREEVARAESSAAAHTQAAGALTTRGRERQDGFARIRACLSEILAISRGNPRMLQLVDEISMELEGLS